MIITAFHSLACKLIALSQDAPSTWKYDNEIDTRIFPISKDWYQFFEDYNVKSIAPVRSTNIINPKGGLAIEDNNGKTYFFNFEDFSYLFALNDWMKDHKAALVMKDGAINWVTKKPCPKPFWINDISEVGQSSAIERLTYEIEHSLFKRLKKVYKNSEEETLGSIKERFPEAMWSQALAVERVRELEKNLSKKDSQTNLTKKAKI